MITYTCTACYIGKYGIPCKLHCTREVSKKVDKTKCLRKYSSVKADFKEVNNG